MKPLPIDEKQKTIVMMCKSHRNYSETMQRNVGRNGKKKKKKNENKKEK